MSDRDTGDQFALVNVDRDGRLTIEVQSVNGSTLHRIPIPMIETRRLASAARIAPERRSRS